MNKKIRYSSSVSETFLGGLYSKALDTIKKEYSISNDLELPYIEKVVVSTRLGRDASDKNAVEAAIRELTLIAGRKPCISKSKKAIAGLKLKENQVSGAFCTLRGKISFEFLERLIYVALPRIRDFRGFTSKSLDAQNNLTFGIKEHLVFQEIDYDKIYKTRGLDITIVIKNSKSKKMTIDLLRAINFPIKM